MPLFFWPTLGAAVAATILGLVVLAISIVRILRASDRLSNALEQPLARVSAGSEALAARAEKLEASRARLQASLAELEVSRAKLDTIRWGLAEPLRLYRLLRAVIPEK